MAGDVDRGKGSRFCTVAGNRSTCVSTRARELVLLALPAPPTSTILLLMTAQSATSLLNTNSMLLILVIFFAKLF
jgi:hypothetical protein